MNQSERSGSAEVTIVWSRGGNEIWMCADGVVGIGIEASDDPLPWTNFSPDEWRAIVEATREVWEREHPSITKMRQDVEAMQARGEHIPVEIAHFLETHPPRRSDGIRTSS